jgi:sugar O-acyltransferase (sialic acid O-acetyltransferase NeuD family)
MVIAGAGGLAKEILEIFFQHNQLNNLYFFDNISENVPEKLFDKFPVLTSLQEVSDIFRKDSSFSLGLGSPVARYKLNTLLEEAGGELKSVISKHAMIGHFGTTIGMGSVVMDGVVITNDVSIGKACLINPLCCISHDAVVGDYVEFSPGVRITGHCRIGDFSTLGTNAVVLPRVSIGKNVIVGAGAVVTQNVPDNTVVAGVPAVVKRSLPPISLNG